jgi:F-type H+-transporting ATPase subunit b
VALSAPLPAAPAAASGMPQFDLAQWPGQIVWVLIVFALLYVLLAKVFVPRLAGTIEARETRISGEIGDARRMRDEALEKSAAAAGEMAQAKARARAIADEATAKVKAKGEAQRAAEDAKLGQILAAADEEIAAARATAMTHVQGIAMQTAAAMIERLTGAAASAAELGAADNALAREPA